MTKWAIVAIPEDGESVWQTSSEKIPHMTLLCLGEQSDPDKALHITEYIRHAVNSSIHKFGINVRNRGFLGDDQADVLFFENATYDDRLKSVIDFRSYLLSDPVINEAYNSIEQYPGWTPHLTLGYPSRPAKKGEGIASLPPYTVYFDKIALWVDDFDGPTFNLGYQDQYAMAMDSLAHRNALQAKMHNAPETARDVVMRNVLARKKLREPSNLKHYGIGARKVDYTNPIDIALKKTLNPAAQTSKSLSTEGRFVKHAISGELSHGSTSESKKIYIRENQLAFLRHFDHFIGGSPSERAGREFDLTTRPDGDWVLSSINRIAHTGTVESHIRPQLDPHGMIVDYAIVHDQLSQDDVSLALMHFGVKGMKWGVRRKRPNEGGDGSDGSGSGSDGKAAGDAGPGTHNTTTKTSADRKAEKAFDRKHAWRLQRPKPSEEAATAALSRKRVNKHGTNMLTNKELQELVTRMNLEQQYATLQANKKSHTARAAGQAYVADILKETGKEIAKETLKWAFGEAVKKAAASRQSSPTTPFQGPSQIRQVPQLQLPRAKK